MHSCEAIQLSIDYIENNLDKNLSTKMLADMVGLSMFYYQRLFCRLVHKPVQEYIKLRRLAHSIELLNIPDKKIRLVFLSSYCRLIILSSDVHSIKVSKSLLKLLNING